MAILRYFNVCQLMHYICYIWGQFWSQNKSVNIARIKQYLFLFEKKGYTICHLSNN